MIFLMFVQIHCCINHLHVEFFSNHVVIICQICNPGLSLGKSPKMKRPIFLLCVGRELNLNTNETQIKMF